MKIKIFSISSVRKNSLFYILCIFSAIILFFPLNVIVSQEKDQAVPGESKPSEKQEEKDYEDFLEKYKKRQRAGRAAVLGIIPGVGQFSNKNYLSGATQMAAFATFWDIAQKNEASPDYIPDEERYVDFDIQDMFIADILQKQNLLYQDIPFITESNWDRDLRLWKEQKLAELNPLLQYGPYERLNVSTANADLASQSMMHTMFYSVYSAYRDAGGVDESKKDETFMNLAAAPFKPRYLSDPHVFVPLIVLLGLNAYYPPSGPYTLVSPGMKSSGYLGFYTTAISFNAGVGEEAFFRGYLNHSLSTSFSPLTGGLISGSFFGLAHLQPGDSLGDVLPQTLAGFYFAYLHYTNDYDIRPGIALHFWWDVIVIGFSLARYKEDRNVDKGQAEVHYMPTFYQMRF